MEKREELNDSLDEKIKKLKIELTSWKRKESSIQAKIDKKKEELDKKGIPFDLGKINQITTEVIYYEKKLKELKCSEKRLQQLESERIALVIQRSDLKSKIYNRRCEFAREIKDNLKDAVDGLQISLKYKQGCFSPDFEENIKSLMDWRTAQVPKAKYIATNMSPAKFVNCIKEKTLEVLKQIKDKDDKFVFTDKDIQNILIKCTENNNYEDFEAIAYEDSPKLTVTKLIKNSDGKIKPITRSIAKLSLGQQQSILLAILIQSKSCHPLLIDQPEDNLDSEFIHKFIVANLRKIKETRQVIIVTHNPNIAVLSDAELIVPLKSTSEKTRIENRGSIDKPEITQSCCNILEGGQQAFIKRKQLYGI